MAHDGHYLQTDRRWRGRLFYVPKVASALGRLTEELQRLERGEADTDRRLRSALGAFDREVLRAANWAQRPRPKSIGSINEAGCWLVSQANVLRSLSQRVGRKRPTPDALLDALQDEMLVTLTGFDDWPGLDHLSLVTRGRVYLAAFEDFGRGGAAPSRSRILRDGLGRWRVAIVNVEAHDYLGAGSSTHYVTVTRRVGRNWRMLDPDPRVRNRGTLLPRYRRVYQVWLYRRRKR